jgi:hypothetical protein
MKLVELVIQYLWPNGQNLPRAARFGVFASIEIARYLPLRWKTLSEMCFQPILQRQLASGDDTWHRFAEQRKLPGLVLSDSGLIITRWTFRFVRA